MERVKIGIVGCGGNARGHMRRLKQLPQAEIVAVCDIAEAAAQKAAQEFGGMPYTDYHRLLERDDLDAVYLSLPVFAHGEPELDTIARGLPFFVEKPVARDLPTAARVLAALRRQPVLTCVGYQLRYLAPAQATRRLLANREIGLVEGHYWCGSGRGSGWQVKMALSGGQLVEQATHTLDLMRYFAGEVAEVFSWQSNRVLRGIDCPDVYSVALRFASGAVGTLSTAWHLDPSDWNEANILNITFEGSRVRWTAGSATLVPESADFDGGGNPSPSIDEVFVRAVQANEPSLILSPYEDAVKSLAISLAANESARLGQPIRVAAD